MQLLAQIEAEVDGRKLGGFSAWKLPSGSWQINLKLPDGAFACHTLTLTLEGSLIEAFGLGTAEPADDFGDVI